MATKEEAIKEAAKYIGLIMTDGMMRKYSILDGSKEYPIVWGKPGHRNDDGVNIACSLWTLGVDELEEMQEFVRRYIPGITNVSELEYKLSVVYDYLHQWGPMDEQWKAMEYSFLF